MNRSILSEPSAVDGCPRCLAIKIDGPNRGYHNVRNMPPSTRRTAAFSLVEVTLALGVAAICLTVLLGLMPTARKDSADQHPADHSQPDYFADLFLFTCRRSASARTSEQGLPRSAGPQCAM